MVAELNLDIERLSQATQRLTEAQREVISLRFAGGLSIIEVAKIMGKSQGAIKALQHSAIVALRKTLLVRDNEKVETVS
jgi:RNA polymerase sigma-70 factor (ECF subfamily)